MREEIIRQHRRHDVKKIVVRTVIYFILSVLAVSMIVPIYWTFMTSLMQNKDINHIPINFFPNPSILSFDNYVEAFQSINIFRFLGNSVIVTGLNIVTSLLSSSMAAYAITKIKFRGAKILYRIFLASMMLPGMVMIVPTYLIINKLRMLNSLFSVIVPGILSVYGIFFMRAFFLGTNDSIGESARVDGASEFRIFLQIFMPQVTVGLVILGINTFNGSWNAYLQPSLYLKKESVWTLVVALRNVTSKTAEIGVQMAFALLFSLPVFISFVFAQKYFLTGFTLAGIKE